MSRYLPPWTVGEGEKVSGAAARRILVIDDIRTYDGAVHARTSEHGLLLLQTQQWDEVWLDHDLGGSDTIKPVVEWMEQNELDLDAVWIITANPAGRHWIVQALRGKYPLAIKPGGTNMSLKMLVNV